MKNDAIDNLKLIGKNVKKLRQIKEITVKELSLLSGVSQSMISQIENLKQKPTPITLRKMLAPLGFSLCLFLSHSQEEILEFDFSPEEIVQDKFKRILMLGERDGTRMELLRPTLKGDDLAMIEINMLPDCRLFSDEINVRGKIRAFQISGRLLLEFKDDEFTIEQGQQFEFDGSKSFNLRNFTDESNVFILIVEANKF